MLQARLQKAWTSVGLPVLIFVLGTYAVSFVGKLAGFWPTVWRGVTFPVPVPAILLVAVVVLVVYRARRWFAGVSKTRGGPLSDVESKIVTVLTAADGEPLNVDQIAQAWNLPKLVVKDAAESLMDRRLLRDNFRGWDICQLSEKGAKFAIENGYVQTAPDSSASRHP